MKFKLDIIVLSLFTWICDLKTKQFQQLNTFSREETPLHSTQRQCDFLIKTI